MTVSKNKVVSLTYELRLNGADGEVIQTVDVQQPLVFIFGTNSLIPGFERNVDGLKIGDNFSFLLPCEEAYGASREDLVLELPKASFIVDTDVDNDLFFEGNTIPLQDSQGNRMDGVVVEVKDDTVVMDFNHPLSDESLYFSGSIVGIREASDEELNKCSSAGKCDGCSGGCS